MNKFSARVLEHVKAAEEKNWPGRRKRRWVVDELAADIDNLIDFGDGPIGRFLECWDGPVVKWFFGVVVDVVVDLVINGEKPK